MSLFASKEYFYDRPLRGEGRSSRWAAYIIRAVAYVVFKICFRFRIEGKEYLDLGAGKAAVIAGNHVSIADPLFPFLATHDNCRFLAKEELLEGNKFIAQCVARVGAFPLKRNSADRIAIKRAVAAIKRGEFVGIYPEGTRIKDIESQSVENHAGAVLIANMAQCPIIPVGISGAEKIKAPGSIFLHFPKIIVRFGAPINPRDFDYLPKPERAEACINEVMRRCHALRKGEKLEPFVIPASVSSADTDEKTSPQAEGE